MTLSLNQARKILGKDYQQFTDEQINDLLSQFYGFAETVAEIIVIRGSKEQPMGIDPTKGKENNGNTKPT